MVGREKSLYEPQERTRVKFGELKAAIWVKAKGKATESLEKREEPPNQRVPSFMPL